MEKVIMKECKKHGLTEFVLRKDGGYRCRKCSVDAVQKRRDKVKELLVAYKGGKCERCGYDTCIAALEFHHIDSAAKDFAISSKGYTRSLEKCKKKSINVCYCVRIVTEKCII